MSRIFDRLSRAMDRLNQGRAYDLALRKRKLERELRAAGFSRAHAVAEASRRLADEGR